VGTGATTTQVPNAQGSPTASGCSSNTIASKQPPKQPLYNAAIDYSAPLQQQINPDLIGAHPHAQQHQQQVRQQQQQQQQQQQPQQQQQQQQTQQQQSQQQQQQQQHQPVVSTFQRGNFPQQSHKTMNMMAMADVMSKYQQQQHQQQQQQRQQQHNLQPQQQHATQKGLEGLLLTNTNTSNNNSSSSSSSSISNLIISHNSASNTGNKMQPTWGQSDAISALWGCSSSSSGCSSGSGSQPSLSPTASSNGNDGSKMMLWAAQSSPQNAATLRDGFKELQRQQPPQQQVPQQQPHAASPTASLTSSSSSSNGWSASHYGKPNIWELPGSTGQRTPASSHDIFTDLLCNLSISQDNSSQQASSKADASDVSSNSSSSAGELLEAANIWRFPEYASSQLYMEEPTGGAAACMQLFNDYLNMN